MNGCSGIVISATFIGPTDKGTNVDKLLKLKADLDAKIRALLTSDGPLTAEQKVEHQTLKDQLADVKGKIKDLREMDADAASEKADADAAAARADEERITRERAERSNAGRNRITDRDSDTNIVTPKVHAEPRDVSVIGTFGYQNFGQFALDVRQAAITKRPPERFLKGFDLAEKAAATGMGEAVGSDGGFFVPPDFAQNIFARVYAEDGLLARTDIYTIARNSIVFPRIDETSRVAGSRAGGVQAYWADEADSVTATKPKVGRLTMNLHKLMAFGRSTDELLEDSVVAIEQFLTKHFSDEINFIVGNSLVNGTGAGHPLGILNADCLVSVSKESGQTAATLYAANILKMWSRMWARSRQNAVWLINQDVEPQLYSMQIGSGVANQVVYMPPGGLSAAPYATLMGRPVMPVEYCSTLGTVGDIILVDLSQWVTAVKGGGPKSAVSMHLYFDTDEMAFRTTYRLDSQPWWPAALTPFKGSNTQSPAVALATRA